MKKLLTIVIVMLFANSLIKSQNTDSVYTFEGKHSIGVGAGVTTGVGLMYRYTPGKFGFQAAFSPLYIDNNEAIISIGATLLYNIVQAEKANFYLYQGNHFFTDMGSELTMFNGVGMGIELILWKNIGYNIMVGYGFYDTFKIVTITGETGLFFRL